MVQPNYKEIDEIDNNNVEEENSDSVYTTEDQEEFSDEDCRHVKKKRYQRHAKHQIQEMEAFFKECPHPDEKQRKELSRQLGLDHLRIKFWFQNKRTHNKNQQQRRDNRQLRTENDKLRAENQRYREAIANASCPNCGKNQTAIGDMSFDEHHLCHENGRLETEVHRLSAMAEKHAGKMAMSNPVAPVPPPVGREDVTPVERVEVEDGGVADLFKNLVSTGHCEGLNNSVMPTTFPSSEHDGCLTMSNPGKRSLLKLGERMARSFFGGVNNSAADMWTKLSGYAGDNIRVMTRSSSADRGSPSGVILCAATSFSVPAPPNTIFDFLRDENNRTSWDVLTLGGSVSKLAQIPNGKDIRNCVSLLGCTNGDGSKIMMIQESYSGPTTSSVVYAPIDDPDIDMVLHGGDSDKVALLPSGFAIRHGGTSEGGSLLTIALQILADQSTSAMPANSVSTIRDLISVTMQSIKTIFPCPTA